MSTDAKKIEPSVTAYIRSVAVKYASEYPNVENVPVRELVYALESTLEGTNGALSDWQAHAARLEAEKAELLEALLALRKAFFVDGKQKALLAAFQATHPLVEKNKKGATT